MEFLNGVVSYIRSSSVVVKGICGVVFFGYFLTFIHSLVDYISAVPGFVLPPDFRVWTLVTTSCIEFHFWMVIFDVILVLFCGRLLEPVWGALEMLIFFLVTNVISSVVVVFLYLTLYYITKNEHYLFNFHIHGMAAYFAGVAVATKQLMPDQVIFQMPCDKLRNKHLPFVFLTTSILLVVAGAFDQSFPFLYGTGTLVSWVYLRFYQKHPGGIKGDRTESFSFVSFFPSSIQPFAAVLSNTVFKFLVTIKVCKKVSPVFDMRAPSSITITIPGASDPAAERRRQLALKALNERLQSTGDPSNTHPWPSMEVESPNSSAIASFESSSQNPTSKPVMGHIQLKMNPDNSALNDSEREQMVTPPSQLPDTDNDDSKDLPPSGVTVS